MRISRVGPVAAIHRASRSQATARAAILERGSRLRGYSCSTKCAWNRSPEMSATLRMDKDGETKFTSPLIREPSPPAIMARPTYATTAHTEQHDSHMLMKGREPGIPGGPSQIFAERPDPYLLDIPEVSRSKPAESSSTDRASLRRCPRNVAAVMSASTRSRSS